MRCTIHWQSNISSIITVKPMARLSHVVLIIANMNALMCVPAKKEFHYFHADYYGDIDVQAILQNDDLREEYYECFVQTGPCKKRRR